MSNLIKEKWEKDPDNFHWHGTFYYDNGINLVLFPVYTKCRYEILGVVKTDNTRIVLSSWTEPCSDLSSFSLDELKEFVEKSAQTLFQPLSAEPG